MQLWLKGVVSEYAMNKPPEDEIWPEAKAVEFKLWPSMLPDEMELSLFDRCDVKWDLSRLEGATMRMNLEGHPRDYLDRVALIWSVQEIYRTHCPRCGEKIKGSAMVLSSNYGGHEGFSCPANREFDERYPREW